MHHHDFITSIDGFFDGTLDIVEHREFLEHERQCHDCSRKLVDRYFTRLNKGTVVLDDPPPLPCLSDCTLKRWSTNDLPPELAGEVTSHILACEACAERSLQWPQSVTSR